MDDGQWIFGTNIIWRVGNPIVVVQKGSSYICIFGDYGCNVNPRLSMVHKPLQVLDDMSLLSVKYFVKWFKLAYMRLLVGEQDQKILL